MARPKGGGLFSPQQVRFIRKSHRTATDLAKYYSGYLMRSVAVSTITQIRNRVTYRWVPDEPGKKETPVPRWGTQTHRLPTQPKAIYATTTNSNPEASHG